jgi:hypothetical protein
MTELTAISAPIIVTLTISTDGSGQVDLVGQKLNSAVVASAKVETAEDLTRAIYDLLADVVRHEADPLLIQPPTAAAKSAPSVEADEDLDEEAEIDDDDSNEAFDEDYSEENEE